MVSVFLAIDVAIDWPWSKPADVGVVVRPVGTRLNLESSVEAAYNELLGGNVVVDARRALVTSAVFHGRHVKSRELAAVRRDARAKGWGDADVKLALEKLNAQYGPDQAALFKRDLNIRRFEAVVGGVRRWDARFEWHLYSDTGPGDVTFPEWSVSLETKARGQRLCSNMSFEPITGHLVGVSSDRCLSN